MIEECACDKIRRGRALKAVLARVVRQPVAVMSSAKPEEFLASRSVLILYPTAHKLEVILKEVLLAEKLVERDGRYSRNVAPACRNTSVVALESLGANSSYRTVLLLLKSEISEPFFKEAARVVVYTCNAAEHLRVSRPAKSLVSLRTVCGNVEIVALLSPDDIVIKLIYLRISANEISRAAQIRMYDDRSEAVEINGDLGVLVKSDVSEALKAVNGLEAVLVAAEHEGENILCRAVVFVVEVSVLIEHLGVRDDHALAASALDT